MDDLYYYQDFENSLYSELEMKDMYKEIVKTSLKFQSLGMLILFLVLFIEGVIFFIMEVEDSTPLILLLASLIPIIIWYFQKNKANQIRNALDNEQGFYIEIKALRGTKVPTYSWVRFGRSKRLDIRMIQFNDSKVSLYTVYPKLKKIFEFNSKDITFTFSKDQKKFWIQTPSKRHTVYFISNFEEKLKDYLHTEGYEILQKQ